MGSGFSEPEYIEFVKSLSSKDLTPADIPKIDQFFVQTALTGRIEDYIKPADAKQIKL